MDHSFSDWRKELHDTDKELVSLLQRRLELALELLRFLHSEDSSGDLNQDALSLQVLLWSDYEGDSTPLDDVAVKKIFRRIINELRRLAYLNVAEESGDDTALTLREREVLILIAEDHSLKRIALKLNISLKTVESHKAAIMRKLNIHSSVGLTRYAVKEGLVTLFDHDS